MPDIPDIKGAIGIDDPNWAWQDRKRPRKQPQKNEDLNEAIDRSIKQGGYYEKGVFTVPADASEERVQLVAHKYRSKFGNGLEDRGFVVHNIYGPWIDRRPRPIEPDRRRYIMYAFVSCKVIQPVYDIPDKYVPEMLKAGLRLLE